MITKKQRIELKRIFGAHYATAVSQILINKGVVNKNNSIPYSNSYIYKVFKGIRNNDEVEAAILEFASLKQSKTKKITNQKNKLLNAS